MIDGEIEFKFKWRKKLHRSNVRKRKVSSVWGINKDFYLKKIKEQVTLIQEQVQGNTRTGASSTRKMLEKYPKLKVVMNFK